MAKSAWGADSDAKPKDAPVTVKDVLETLVQELKSLNHPLPLTQKKLEELKG